MDDDAFLAGYDPGAYDRPSIAVDLAALGMIGPALGVALVRRSAPPFQGCWALPGAFVAIDESLDDAARRVLRERVGLVGAAVEQVHSFGAVARDPRMRIVSVAYRALLAPDQVAALPGGPDRCRATLDAGGRVMLDGQRLSLAFDHDAILRRTLDRLRDTIDSAAPALLPDRFTLRALQAVHEAVLGRALNKPAFRRRMLDSGRIMPTGEREAGTAFRPAERYTTQQDQTPW